ncbi:MAG: hypothetical protein VXY93_20920, partial [Pseudomonadota bacterium]|nr:hypothetical protein [Pseudomonadota bacterium]
TPVAVGIASYGDAYDAAYCIVQIADKLNGSYELAEVMIIDDYTDDDNVYITEFGNVKVGTAFAGLGTISGRRTSDNVTEITFVPNAGIGTALRFPLGSYVQIDNEIMRVTTSELSGSGLDVIGVVRGALGSQKEDHLSGSLIKKIKPLPIEFRRPSIIRASGHTFEYIGYGPGNYSTGLPQV